MNRRLPSTQRRVDEVELPHLATPTVVRPAAALVQVAAHEQVMLALLGADLYPTAVVPSQTVADHPVVVAVERAPPVQLREVAQTVSQALPGSAASTSHSARSRLSEHCVAFGLFLL